jgi:hypothetical protein
VLTLVPALNWRASTLLPPLSWRVPWLPGVNLGTLVNQACLKPVAGVKLAGVKLVARVDLAGVKLIASVKRLDAPRVDIKMAQKN